MGLFSEKAHLVQKYIKKSYKAKEIKEFVYVSPHNTMYLYTMYCILSDSDDAIYYCNTIVVLHWNIKDHDF